MLRAQRHFRMRGERCEYIALVILTGQAQQHAGVALLHHELLQRTAWRIEHDALGTILAADALPQCIVAIERRHFERRSAQGMQLASYHRA